MENIRETIKTPPVERNKEHKVKKLLVIDILKKYKLTQLAPGVVKTFYTLSPNALRELLVFGEHEYIIDNIRNNII